MDSEIVPYLEVPRRGESRGGSWMDRLQENADMSWHTLRDWGEQPRHRLSTNATCVLGDAIAWLESVPENSIHAIVTDPTYGVIEYEHKNHTKLRAGRGGVWRIPPS